MVNVCMTRDQSLLVKEEQEHGQEHGQEKEQEKEKGKEKEQEQEKEHEKEHPIKRRSSRLRQDCPTDPKVLRGIARPKSPWQWFLRRLYLEDKLELFNALVKGQLNQDADPQSINWRVAKKHFAFYSQRREQERCRELEESRDDEVSRRAELIWEEEEVRNGTDPNVFGGGRESSYLQDVRWAYTHWPTYVRRRGPGEWSITREAELIKNVPSQGAYGLILYAQEDLKRFQDLCRGVLLKSEVPTEKQNIELEVDKSLAKLREVVGGFAT